MSPAAEPLDIGGSQLIRFDGFDGDLGLLVVGDALPFAARRFFTVQRVPPGDFRGWHAHRQCHQLLVCLRGSVLALVDDGKRSREVRLDDPTVGLYMPPMVWGRQSEYSEDALLMVLASDVYDRDDYIEDRDEFLRLTGSPA
jgi:UDP-2-acetamido-3-amino-2,3-dideoxy-glucuronate N-acetyltransferase